MRTESSTNVEKKETIQPAALLTFDVIHDLALLKIDNPTSAFLSLSNQLLNKGERIYSMGNPLDLGMSIVEGNYNGLLQASRYQKILFSGALNPGMSGGPAINEQGSVIGINVSTQGSDISYLVPVTYLQKLIGSLDSTSISTSITDSEISTEARYQQLIHQSLFNDQQVFYGKLLEQAFKTKKLGNVKVANKITSSLKCWGHSKDKTEDIDKLKYQSIQQSCTTEDDIYIASGINLGQFYYNFEWVTSDELNPFQFYAEIEKQFSHDTLNYTYQEKYITSFQCADNVIALAEHEWKISTCFRVYKDYPDLYDSQLVMASIDDEHGSLIAKIGASAISKENTSLLFKRFMESISWNK